MKLINYSLASLIAIISFNNFAFAQKQKTNNLLNASNPIIKNEKPNGGSKSTASRLIGEINASYNGAIYEQTDSTAYSYSNGRGFSKTFGWLSDLTTSYNYNPSISNYDNSGKINYSYDATNHITSIVVQNWNTSANMYQNSTFYTVSYDANSNLSLYIIQNWDAAGSIWINSSKYNLTYDANNNNLTSTATNWDVATSTWKNQNHNIYTYDANNNNLTSVYQNWNSVTNAWENNYKVINTYTTFNKISTSINQNWDVALNVWINNNNSINTYNASNLVSLAISKYWNTTTNVWDNGSQTYHQYNSSNDDTLNLTQYWNGSSWDNAYKYIQTYNANHNLTLQINQNWNSSSTLFENRTRSRSTYNSFNQETSLYQDSWNVSGFWNPDTLNFDYASRKYYESYQTGIESINLNNGSINAYPNPTANLLNINVNTEDFGNSVITIFNIQGVLVKQWNIGKQSSYNTTISTQLLAAGNYYILIKGENAKQLTQSFIVSK